MFVCLGKNGIQSETILFLAFIEDFVQSRTYPPTSHALSSTAAATCGAPEVKTS